MYNNPHFQVLDNIEILPGYYMMQDGQEVPWDGSDQSHLIIHERLTLRECRAKYPDLKLPVDNVATCML